MLIPPLLLLNVVRCDRVIPGREKQIRGGSWFPSPSRFLHARATHFAFSMTASTFPSRIARLSTAWSFSF